MVTIGPMISIQGELSTDDDLLVEGSVRGHIEGRGNAVTIGPDANIEATVRGSRVIVFGRVTGHVVATERIELDASADVRGSLSANRVVVADGARFTGKIDMNRRTIAAIVARFRGDSDRAAK